MKTLCAALVLAGIFALAPLRAADSFPLWPEGAPGALGKEDKDIPTLTVYLPEEGQANGTAVVICPGGGYCGLANHEGEHYARFLNEQGIAGFVWIFRRSRADRAYLLAVFTYGAVKGSAIVRPQAAPPPGEAPPGPPPATPPAPTPPPSPGER